MMELKGKRALITGASSGIGRSLALALGRNGTEVVVAARRVNRLQQLAAEIVTGGTNAYVFEADLSSRKAAGDLARRILHEVGPVDILVNNAGTMVPGTLASVGSSKGTRKLFEVNFWSPLSLITELLPSLIDRDEGAIVNISSVMKDTNWPLAGAYASSKAALSAATETLRMELDGTGIEVVHVIPGPVATDMNVRAKRIPGMDAMMSLSTTGDPDELAARILKRLRKGSGQIIYPSINRPAVHFPRVIQRMLLRRSRRTFKKGFERESITAG